MAFAAVLAGCATFEVEPFLREQITGDTWRACLAREYQRQAGAQLRIDGNWGAAALLAAKGRGALDGREVGPEAPVTSDQAAALSSLQAALARREVSPCECAVVQARYDGWSVAASRHVDDGSFIVAFGKAVKTCVTSR